MKKPKQNMHLSNPNSGSIRSTPIKSNHSASHPNAGGSAPAMTTSNSAHGGKRVKK